MYKYPKLIWFLVLLMITSVLLAGCKSRNWNPGHDDTTKSMSFGFSDSTIFEKGSIISDKNNTDDFAIYVFITNGNKDMNHNSNNKYIAENVKISAIDVANNKIYDLATININNNYGTISSKDFQIKEFVDGEMRIKLRAEGKIIHISNGKGKPNYWNSMVGYSNEFKIIGNFDEETSELRISPDTHTIELQSQTSATFKAEAFIGGQWKNVSDKANWYSSDTKVAVMKNNVAEAVGIGQCKIIATYEGKTASAALTVVRPNAALNKVIVSPPKAEIYVGDTISYTAFGIFGSQKLNITNIVSWSVSDPSIATISDSGVVTGLIEGKVTITAFYKKNTGNNDQVTEGTATLTIKGKPSPIPPNERLIWEREIVE